MSMSIFPLEISGFVTETLHMKMSVSASLNIMVLILTFLTDVFS